MIVEAVIFKRRKNSEWEFGLMINGDSLIIDTKSKPVTKVPWTYQRTHTLLVEINETVPPMKGDKIWQNQPENRQRLTT